MVARKIPLNHRTITGFVQTNKGGDYTGFESSLERDALILLEFNPLVKSYSTQHRKFHYENEGKKRHYTPDIFVTYYDDTSLYIEVKYREDLKKDWITLKPKFKAVIKELSMSKNIRFKIWTEKEIRSNYLKNATFLLPYKQRDCEQYQLEMILKVISRLGKTNPKDTINVCASTFESQAEFLNTLWYAIANFIVKTDLSQPLSMQSKIWLSS